MANEAGLLPVIRDFSQISATFDGRPIEGHADEEQAVLFEWVQEERSTHTAGAGGAVVITRTLNPLVRVTHNLKDGFASVDALRSYAESGRVARYVFTDQNANPQRQIVLENATVTQAPLGGFGNAVPTVAIQIVGRKIPDAEVA